jgi:hypothetical protein
MGWERSRSEPKASGGGGGGGGGGSGRVGTEAQKFEMKKTARLFFVAPSKLRQFIVYAFLERHAVVLLTKLYRPRLCSKDQT